MTFIDNKMVNPISISEIETDTLIQIFDFPEMVNYPIEFCMGAIWEKDGDNVINFSLLIIIEANNYSIEDFKKNKLKYSHFISITKIFDSERFIGVLGACDFDGRSKFFIFEKKFQIIRDPLALYHFKYVSHFEVVEYLFIENVSVVEKIYNKNIEINWALTIEINLGNLLQISTDQKIIGDLLRLFKRKHLIGYNIFNKIK